MAVMTAMMIASLVGSGIQATGGLINAGKQRNLEKDANLAAEKNTRRALELARANPYKALGLRDDVYKNQADLIAQASSDALASGAGDTRGLATNVLGMQNAANQAMQQQTQKDYTDIETAVADQEAKGNISQGKIYSDRAQGAQEAAKAAREARATSLQSGLKGVTGLIGTGSMMPAAMKKVANPKYAAALAADPNTKVPKQIRAIENYEMEDVLNMIQSLQGNTPK